MKARIEQDVPLPAEGYQVAFKTTSGEVYCGRYSRGMFWFLNERGTRSGIGRTGVLSWVYATEMFAFREIGGHVVKIEKPLS